MKLAITLTTLALTVATSLYSGKNQGWQILFDGRSLDGWESNEETANVFSITANGALMVEGGRAHLFWLGLDQTPATFTNFELRAEVKTTQNSNSGIFFHTRFQEKGWPQYGLEAQVNSSHKDARKTGSIYALKDVLDVPPHPDDTWFEYTIRVEGKSVSICIDGTEVNSYTEPENFIPLENRPTTRLDSGTFALQAHDPKSLIYYRNIRVKPLPLTE